MRAGGLNKQKFIIKTREIKKNCLQAVYNIKQEDGIYQVTIEKYVEDKSAEQRGWWHMMIGIMAKDLGYSPAEMKSVLKNEILGQQEIEYKGKTIVKEASSEELKKYGYSELIEHTYRIASENGIILPNPDIRKR